MLSEERKNAIMEQVTDNDDHVQPPVFSGYDHRSDDSETMSITSSVLSGTIGEGRRTYAVYGQEEYGFPMDAQEFDRLENAHKMYYALLRNQLYLAPITDRPQRILDLGCGTGTWTIDMADRFPDAQVVGVDIAPTQPDLVPPNCIFEIDDVERDWIWPPGTADFVFARDLIAGIRNFPRVIEQAYTNLKPGGWLELQSTTPLLGCDDGTMPPNSKVQAMADHLVAACVPWGTPAEGPTWWKGWMEERGFVNVVAHMYKVPCGPWPKDPRLRLVGMVQHHNMSQNLEGILYRLLQRGLGWSEEQVIVFAAHVREEMKNDKIHAWWPLWVFIFVSPVVQSLG
jgi:SAM-dependent methyltransferase